MKKIVLLFCAFVLLLSGCGRWTMSEQVHDASLDTLQAVNSFLKGELSADAALIVADKNREFITDFGTVADRDKDIGNSMAQSEVCLVSIELFLYTTGDRDYNDIIKVQNGLADLLGRKQWPGYEPTLPPTPSPEPTPTPTPVPRVSKDEASNMIALIKDIFRSDGFEYDVEYDPVEDVYKLIMTFDDIGQKAQMVKNESSAYKVIWDNIRNTVSEFCSGVYKVMVDFDPLITIQVVIVSDTNSEEIILIAENSAIIFDSTKN